MDTDQWLAQYRDRVDGLQHAAADLEENLADATVTVSSPDEAVTVTIGSNGSLRDLKFSPRAGEHSYVQLASLVMTTVARGQRAVAEKVVAAFTPIGSETATMDLLTQFVPPEPPVEQQSGSPFSDLTPAPPVVDWAAPARPTSTAVDTDDDMSEDRPW